MTSSDATVPILPNMASAARWNVWPNRVKVCTEGIWQNKYIGISCFLPTAKWHQYCDVCDQRKSYTGNAVVITSTCSLLVFFAVGLTLSHYWDVVQRRRFSSVPLCGLDGPFRYQLVVVTGKRPGAGERCDLYSLCRRNSIACDEVTIATHQ